MSKTARELLEEATTMITTPIIKIGDDVITGWVKGEEIDIRYLTQMPEYNKHWDEPTVEVLDDDLVKTTRSDEITFKGVCSIGAIALANLSNEGLKFDGLFSNWDTQVMENREVALATVALARSVLDYLKKVNWDWYDRKVQASWAMFDSVWGTYQGMEPDAFRFKTLVVEDKERLRRLFIEGSYEDFLTLSHDELGFMAYATGNYITSFNDSNDTTYTQVVDVFNTAIKNLIKAEETVA